MAYDSGNIFAKILRGEIPSNKVYEDEFAYAFHDITPAAPAHILVIPKAAFRNYAEFVAGASPELLQGFFRAVATIAAQEKLGDFRLISNNGEGAGQTVHHFHMHILAGKTMRGLLPE